MTTTSTPAGPNGFATSAARSFNGIPNFRDFGGHPTSDGRRVREGVLFRSQGFGSATEEDLEQLARIGIRLVCDLRSNLERTESPGRWPSGHDPVRLHLDIRTDARAGHREFIDTVRSQPDARGVELGMLINYRGMPAAFAPVLPQLFEHLLDANHLPAVIHCHAGKDRTGFICAVILAALGVDREHMVADYLLTAKRINTAALSEELARSFSSFVGVPLDADAMRPALEARREYLDAALDVLETKYGGIEGYLARVGGVDAARLRRLRSLLLY